MLTAGVRFCGVAGEGTKLSVPSGSGVIRSWDEVRIHRHGRWGSLTSTIFLPCFSFLLYGQFIPSGY